MCVTECGVEGRYMIVWNLGMNDDCGGRADCCFVGMNCMSCEVELMRYCEMGND
jgi:hypothetical protein